MDPISKMIRNIQDKYSFDDEVVLSAMTKVPRHKFVEAEQAVCYSDNPVSIGYGQTISQPYTVAYMTHLLVGGFGFHFVIASRNRKVLEIGTGSGYQAAVLAELVGKVYTIEIIPELAERARKTLKRLGYKNVFVKKGSGEYGWEEYAPYDGIIVTAALENKVPQELKDQLKVGGVIVAPIGPRDLQVMTRYTKVSENELEKEVFGKFVFVPFVEE